MEIKRYLIFFIIALLVLTLPACVRPASKAPAGTVTATTSFPLPGTSDDVMVQLEDFATQTARALEGLSSPTATSATQEPTEATATPQVTEPPAEPTTSTPVPVVVSTTVVPSSYKLLKGEHPYCIARRFNVNPNEMLSLSGLSGFTTFPPGTKLTIPKTGNTFPANRSLRAHPTTYTAISGDTIYTVACRFGDVDPNAIAQVNSLSSPYKLTAGQSLQIP